MNCVVVVVFVYLVNVLRLSSSAPVFFAAVATIFRSLHFHSPLVSFSVVRTPPQSRWYSLPYLLSIGKAFLSKILEIKTVCYLVYN